MATSTYMLGRKKYARPQGMLWSENAGTLVEDPNSDTDPKQKFYVPIGYEINANTGTEPDTSLFNQFLILSDNGRSPIDFKPTRIEIRERMINGRMRSYHVADKMQITVSWDNLPSRAFAFMPNFGSDGQSSMTGHMGQAKYKDEQHTTDGGAGGVELLDWYNNHQGSFWIYLAYDNYANFGKEDDAYGHLAQYNEIMEVFFSNFSYTVTKRGNSTHDLWNVSVTLEEA